MLKFKKGQKVFVITNCFGDGHFILYEGKYVRDEAINAYRAIVNFGGKIGKHGFSKGQVFDTPQGALNFYNKMLDETEQRIAEIRQDLVRIEANLKLKEKKNAGGGRE